MPCLHLSLLTLAFMNQSQSTQRHKATQFFSSSHDFLFCLFWLSIINLIVNYLMHFNQGHICQCMLYIIQLPCYLVGWSFHIHFPLWLYPFTLVPLFFVLPHPLFNPFHSSSLFSLSNFSVSSFNSTFTLLSFLSILSKFFILCIPCVFLSLDLNNSLLATLLEFICLFVSQDKGLFLGCFSFSTLVFGNFKVFFSLNSKGKTLVQ